MANSNQQVYVNGPSFVGLLTLLFVALKLTGVINWSWLWVLSPLWLGLALSLAILLVVGVVVVGIILLKAIFS